MAMFMSDEQLAEAMRDMAERGQLVETGWKGFRAIMEGRRGTPLTEDEAWFLRWTFWAGARCVFDCLDRLTHADQGEPLEKRVENRIGYLKALAAELGADPFCRPPNPPKEETLQ